MNLGHSPLFFKIEIIRHKNSAGYVIWLGKFHVGTAAVIGYLLQGFALCYFNYFDSYLRDSINYLAIILTMYPILNGLRYSRFKFNENLIEAGVSPWPGVGKKLGAAKPLVEANSKAKIRPRGKSKRVNNFRM
ncbi:hypothetical protein V3F56_14550, partial [Moorellaceae bacterium AZ2]